MKRNRKTGMLLLFFAAFFLITFGACGKEKENYVKTGEVDFTVVEEADVPKELLEIIRDKKKEVFHMTYLAEDALYVSVGYGEQASGGYSISVEELFEAKEGICLKTKLTGPSADEKVTASLTYPFIVLKLKPVETKMIFLK